ncbi:LacI family DNA-binding transcriptional regulator [Streptomyces paludis]|uniref:LacI family transcriptional regulator n=1 Tax=Streptomyces paludis TaxID=2282738 RepID=A0A345HM18_9ACTN|nr:LacI family DNA-binding transcriptional regulator [Streptomyces paludis]AXG77742.1 LacI family transcriptional regulator [Streptomyces paludis]
MARTTPSGGGRDRPPTLALVAQRAGVSPQTVSNALNSPELLATETLERVRRAITELDYRPHQAARLLRTRSSLLIGYGVQPTPDGVARPVMEHFLHALSDSAHRAGYRVLLFAVPAAVKDEPDCYAELLRERSVDAFVIGNTYRGDPRPDWLRKRDIPFVSFGRPWAAREQGDWVDVDGAHGTGAAVDHLAALGHRRIAFLGWPRGSGTGDDRARGWREAMARHALPVRGLRAASRDDVEAAREAIGPLLDRGVTAVVTASDTLALGCYRALLDSGRTPGRDVAVVGFDDSAAAAMLAPALSTVRQPLEEAGRSCTRLLLARIKDPAAEPEQVLLTPELVVRDSSGGGVSGR